MRRALFGTVIMLAFSAQVFADEVGRLPCNEANLDALRGASRAAVIKFINATRPQDMVDEIPSPKVVGEFGWANLGGAKSDFVVLLDFSERGFFNRLWIYRCGTEGDLKIQEIEGWEMGNLKKMFRDLNGDGKDEAIIPTELDWPPGSWTPTAEMPTWPAVYRLRDGRYIEASRDFPNFYDKEVLPSLVTGPQNPPALAVVTMRRDKILRTLGRDPAAGLEQAYQWMNSDDPQLRQCAIATLGDIGGHDKEVLELQQALPAAIRREIETRKGG